MQRVDSFADDLRARSVSVGVMLTALVTVIVIAYSATTWDRPERSLLIALVAGATGVAFLVQQVLPTEPVLRSRWREPFFFTWSLINVLVVSGLVVIDGTDESPLALIYVLPLIFAASSYPLGLTIAVSLADVGACLSVGLSDGGSPERAIVLTGLLGAAACMCALQARNHDRQREALGRMSRTDSLTGAFNRRGFEERLDAALRTVPRSGEPVALLLMDLDGFKWVNDRNGHAEGDALLRWTAERIAACIRAGDVVGRIGGDEFAVVAPGADGDAGRELAGCIAVALGERIGVSIGVAVCPHDGTAMDELHRSADERLYGVKRGRPGPGAVAATAPSLPAGV